MSDAASVKLTPIQIRHLYLRAGFSETPAKIREESGKTPEEIVSELFHKSDSFELLADIPDPLKGKNKGVSNFSILAMIIRSRGEMQNMNFQWLYRMAESEAGLREKMTLFWHNHFATSVPFSWLMQQQNNMFRANALGKFSTLLHETAKDPAMILYLNNQQNKKEHPNENFAREVMELFTLGIGHYTEEDIREAARAFTGWTVNRKGKFEFKQEDHDDGEKQFLGHRGNFTGEQILDILLQQKQTSEFIIRKIYRQFVNPRPDEEHIAYLSEKFFSSGYDIALIMKEIFTSGWFYDQKNIGVIICSPAELIVRYIKLFRLEFEKGETLLNLQQSLGQTLFFPPNVAGWKGGRSWIDGTSLLLRLNIPTWLFQNGKITLNGKPEFEETDQRKLQQRSETGIRCNWSMFENEFSDTDSSNLNESISRTLLQTGSVNIPDGIVEPVPAGISHAEQIRKAVTAVLSLPEFQMI